MPDELGKLEVVRKLAKEARDAEHNCQRTVDLLQPEWDLFEADKGERNLYVSRLYADHTSHVRRNKRDADALEYAIAQAERANALEAVLRRLECECDSFHGHTCARCNALEQTGADHG